MPPISTTACIALGFFATIIISYIAVTILVRLWGNQLRRQSHARRQRILLATYQQDIDDNSSFRSTGPRASEIAHEIYSGPASKVNNGQTRAWSTSTVKSPTSPARLRHLPVSHINEKNNTSNVKESRKILVGFFHPYCNAGGGGERVLWAAVRATLEDFPQTIAIVYTGDRTDGKEILQNAKSRFGIDIDSERIYFVYLRKRNLVEPNRWPHFTLLGQSLGSMVLAYEALSTLVPDIWVDTMGYAFSYPLASKLFSIPVLSYTHYPTIQSEMIDKVKVVNIKTLVKRIYYSIFSFLYLVAGSYCEDVMVNSNWTLAHMKRQWWLGHASPEDLITVYPPCFTEALERFDILNDRERLIIYIGQFRPEKRHEIVIKSFAKLLERSERANAKLNQTGTILKNNETSNVSSDNDVLPSGAQNINSPPSHSRGRSASSISSASSLGSDTEFPPQKSAEKQHAHELVSEHGSNKGLPKLVLIGSVRDEADKTRVYQLRVLCRELGIADQVDFVLDAEWSLVENYLSRAWAGVNAMWNEHFGIGVVEYMAAGVIPVVHASGGPKNDIVIPLSDESKPTGYLYETSDELKHDPVYWELVKEKEKGKSSNPIEEAKRVKLMRQGHQSLTRALQLVLNLDKAETQQFRERARQQSRKFSELEFRNAWSLRFTHLIKKEATRRDRRLRLGYID